MSVAFGDMILVGTGIPGSQDSVSPSCGADCGGQIYTGTTGYILDDRQRLAEAFSFLSPVQVDGVEIGIFQAGANSQVDVYITDGLTTTGAQTADFFDAEGVYPSSSTAPQEVGFSTDLLLEPNVVYYIVLTGQFSSGAETSPDQSNPSPGVSTLDASYYANSGLGSSPIEATWVSFGVPTVSFELTGTAVPEPTFSPLVGFLLLVLMLRSAAHRRHLKCAKELESR